MRRFLTICFNPLILSLIILEVSDLCLSESDHSKLELIPSRNSKTLDCLIKKPICEFFSKVDKFFSDFIENKLPSYEEKPNLSLEDDKFMGISKLINNGQYKGKTPGEMYDKLDTSLSHIENTNEKRNVDTLNLHNVKSHLLKSGSKHIKADLADLSLDSDLASRIPFELKANQRNKRKVGDDFVNHEKYPFLVRIYNNGKYLMTGVSLAENLIGTSASGLFDTEGKQLQPNQITIRSSMESSNNTGELKIRNIYLMPEFNKSVISNYTPFDLALLTTIGSSKFTHYPLIPTKSEAIENGSTIPVRCSVITWERSNNLSLPDEKQFILKNIFINLSEEAKCKRSFDEFDNKTEYCALDMSNGADRGSPLICSDKLTGILSYSSKADGHSQNDIFTKITAFSDFINECKKKAVSDSLKQVSDDILTNVSNLDKKNFEKQKVGKVSFFSDTKQEASKSGRAVVSPSLIILCSVLSVTAHLLINYD